MFLNVHQEKAQKLLDENKLEESLQEFNLALEVNPNSAEIYNQRAVVYIHLNKQHLSLADFNKAIELDSEYAYRYASRAYARDFFGDIDGAIEDYYKAVELDPEDAVANNNLGILLEKKGYQEKAQNHYKKADQIAKIEEQFNKTMLDKEGVGLYEQDTAKPKGETLQPKKIAAEKQQENISFKDILSKKAVFKEFIRFIGNGFKLTKND